MKNKIAALFFVLSAVCSSPLFCADDVAVIVNKQNPIDNLSFRELVDIFKQKKQYWAGDGKVFLVLPEMIAPEAKVILKKVYGMTEAELKRYWLQKIFKEEVAANPISLSSGEAMKVFISRVPTAVGFVEAVVADETVKTLKIDGLSPGDADYVLKA